MSDYTPFKMKGNPFSQGGVQGTNSHASALKKKSEEDINSLLDSRKELKAKRDKLEKPKDGEKKILLGNLRRKRNEKNIKKNQDKINNNETAKSWKNKKKGLTNAEKVKIKKDKKEKGRNWQWNDGTKTDKEIKERRKDLNKTQDQRRG